MEIERTQRQIATVEEVQAMMRRRGYMVRDYTLENDNPYVGSIAYVYAPYLHLTYHTKLEIEELLDRIVGQHHMTCSCGLPVLQELVQHDLTSDGYDVKDGVITFAQPLPDGTVTVQWREEKRNITVISAKVTTDVLYRLASAGPESEPVTTCPRCGTLLREAKEIED